MVKKGERVGAILSADENEVRLLGYGVYDGRMPLEMRPGLIVPNPRITLDSGDIVWGCECWWASEEKIKKSIGSRRVIQVAMGDDGVPHV